MFYLLHVSIGFSWEQEQDFLGILLQLMLSAHIASVLLKKAFTTTLLKKINA